MRPIGVFDSGVGGLSVLKELLIQLPQESYIYFADSGHAPYGAQTSEAIILHCVRITDFLIAKGCKIIVVACNTATAAAITYLRSHYDITFIGMEPAIKPAALNTKTSSIGVLATQGTLKGRLFQETKEKFANAIHVEVAIGKGLVELVENNAVETEEMETLLRKYVAPMLEQSVDHIVLGCTHYPFFSAVLQRIIGDRVKIVNPAPAVARHTKRVLSKKSLLNQFTETPTLQVYSTGETNTLIVLLKSITNRLFNITTL